MWVIIGVTSVGGKKVNVKSVNVFFSKASLFNYVCKSFFYKQRSGIKRKTLCQSTGTVASLDDFKIKLNFNFILESLQQTQS